MSTPLRSPLAVQGDFPDDEALLADILGTGLVELGLLPTVERVDTDTSAFDPPAVTCYAPTGRSSINRIGDLKTSFLYVDCIAPQYERDQAKVMGNAVEKILGEYVRGGIWKGVQIRRVSPVTAPTELPLRYAEDPRHRESGWTLVLNKHRSVTVYP